MLRDTMLVFNRAMRQLLRNPFWVIFGLVQPVLYLVLFGPLLTRIVDQPNFPQPGDAWQIFVPALLVQRAAFLGDFASRPVLVGGLVTIALVAVTVAWGTRTFHRENA